jgi:glycolate oxidase FAD binding subunit
VSAEITIAGVTPGRTLAPADRGELAAMVRDLYASDRTFAFVGGGTELELGNAPRALDTVVRTTALDRVVDYSPEDQTITVEAGMRLAALDAVLAQHGQMLPIQTGDRANATVGGAIATNAFGALRHRYGSIKDVIVGIEIVRPDGTPAHGGGKVVKNVAGFDIPKLMVGSLGTLGGVASATFRVFPVPAVTRAVLLQAAPDSALFAAALDDPSLEPVAVVHYPARGGCVLTFAGLEASVTAQLAHVAQLAALHAVESVELDADALQAFAQIERDVRTSGAWRWTESTSIAAAREVRPLPVEVTADVRYPTLGVQLVSAADADALDAFAREPARGRVFRSMPLRVRDRIDAWGPPPPAFALMRAVKTNFDPKGLCNPGRFVGGL